ncbi:MULTISPECIES: N-acetylmuramoyl-L-alanine amidase [unclassified Psychrobacter]|uniref:N-acetylmuramoyl-L-alanine amidase n=1 Tax=unclassified Psychrobacter TaxID=196806 RepID=UPI00071E83C8|nr:MULTISPECIES: N-acetylmuramoyl-L-alanine amidase [unclassified Psychrobacter]OLF37600.1 N-acetylmuramoyl-L-alanine amidase [Psychrobacter sp. Cmf 22.2]
MAKNITSLALASILTSFMTLPLIGCVATSTPRYVIDSETYQATGKSQRIKTIVLHYTVSDNERSIKTLTTGQVSAHYLILDTDDDKIYNLVPESERAWHAGDSGFAGRTILNDTSIGIEIVNAGIKPEYRDALKNGNMDYHPYEHYVAFDELQIKKVAELVQDIAKRYDISPKNIIGHADMAPSRKIDPGAKFPWERLYVDYGIGAWYDEFDKQFFMHPDAFAAATIPEIKQELREYGYRINDSDEWDKSSRDVVYAFQLRFRPQRPTGEMDLETYAILRALNQKYAGRDDFY